MALDTYHTSVLLTEVSGYLHIQPKEKYIDATLGGAGHTLEILRLHGKVLGLDVDQEALSFAENKVKIQNPDLRIGEDLVLVKGNFREIKKFALEKGFENVAGILMDLGVSGHQFDSHERGFSFSKNATLDMRMDQTLGVTAKDLVNGLTKQELADLFFKYGEEGYSRQIAQKIIEVRKEKPIETTDELASVVKSVVHTDKSQSHPATRVFQALRILVNDELNSLEESLPQCLDLLKSGGRLLVITFHSLEDRIVKKTFEQFEESHKGVILTKKPVVPTDEEMEANRRARSAKLRVFEKGL
jgi:16S rRNA (cytosine1402-N4)-methyltransferase